MFMADEDSYQDCASELFQTDSLRCTLPTAILTKEQRNVGPFSVKITTKRTFNLKKDLIQSSGGRVLM